MNSKIIDEEQFKVLCIQVGMNTVKSMHLYKSDPYLFKSRPHTTVLVNYHDQGFDGYVVDMPLNEAASMCKEFIKFYHE